MPHEEVVSQEEVVSRMVVSEIAMMEEAMMMEEPMMTARPSTAVDHLRTRWGREADGSRGGQHDGDFLQHDFLLFRRFRFYPSSPTCAKMLLLQKNKVPRVNSLSEYALKMLDDRRGI